MESIKHIINRVRGSKPGPVVIKIPVKAGNLGTLNGYRYKVPVRVVKTRKIEIIQL